MCRIYVHLVGNVKGHKRVDCLSDNGKVTGTSHQNSDFFHGLSLLFLAEKNKGALLPLKNERCAQTVGFNTDFCSTVVSHNYPSVAEILTIDIIT